MRRWKSHLGMLVLFTAGCAAGRLLDLVVEGAAIRFDRKILLRNVLPGEGEADDNGAFWGHGKPIDGQCRRQ